MNWKLIFQLSLLGLAMGVATVFFIPSTIEPLFWLAIFATSAWVIAKRCPARLFLHGFAVSMVNSVWITASHLLLFCYYAARHVDEVKMMMQTPLSPGLLMVVVVMPASGVGFGLVLGLFAVVAGRLVNGPAKAE